jgi:hypothetical protein
MSQQYVSITREEFEDTIFYRKNGKRNEFQQVDLDGVWELVYEHPVHGTPLVIRVYSSIHVTSGKSRDVGKDAIRITLVDKENDDGLDKTKRINRVPGWQDRLRKRVLKLYNQIKTKDDKEFKFCHRCGSIMKTLTTRKEGPNKDKKFLKCVSCKQAEFPKENGW